MAEEYKSILEYFGVNSQEELLAFMRDNPNHPDVVELQMLIASTKDEEGNHNV